MQIDYISNSRPLAAEELATSDAFFVKAKGTSLQELHFAVEARVNSTLISVWRGDITTLSCGAIVNAANAGGEAEKNLRFPLRCLKVIQGSVVFKRGTNALTISFTPLLVLVFEKRVVRSCKIGIWRSELCQL